MARDLRGPVNPGGEFNHRSSRQPGMGLGRGTPSSVHGMDHSSCRVEVDEVRGKTLWWSPWGPIGGHGGPARVEKRGRLRTQVGTMGQNKWPHTVLCPLSTVPPPKSPIISFGFSESPSPSLTLFLLLPLSWEPWTVVSIVCPSRTWA